jgi:hypothetical protein
MYYQKIIRERLASMGYIGKYDPRHIEAYMRLEHSTLDGLSSAQFNKEINIAMDCVNLDGSDNAEKCAKSFGL